MDSDNFPLLISAPALKQRLSEAAAQTMLFDCSFDLQQSDAGRAAFLTGHIPGARYVHLDTVLSSQDPDRRASGGRHPLPLREDFAQWLSSVGFSNTMQAVVYDRNGGMFCGRMWWMLKWLGHDRVSVLDGGLSAWQEETGVLAQGEEFAENLDHSPFQINAPLVKLFAAQEVEALLSQAGQADCRIVDARAAARYRGDVEPMDPVAGHIPSAYNRPFTDNFDAKGCYKDGSSLRRDFQTLLGDTPPSMTVHHCGSGVSAIPNLIAMQLAGLGPCALYAGSWSDWVSVHERPVRRGSER